MVCNRRRRGIGDFGICEKKILTYSEMHDIMILKRVLPIDG